MGCDVFGEVAFGELLVIDGLFDGVAEEIGDAEQFDAAFEGGEFSDLFEAVEVLFVGGADHQEVKEQDDAVDGGAARFAGSEEVFEGFDGAFEEVGVFDDTTVCVDERAERFKEVEGGECFGQRTEGVIGGDLADGGVDVHLGFDLNDGISVALRDIKAFDLDVAQHFFKVAAVVGKKHIKDHAIACAEVAFADVFGELEVFGKEGVLLEFVEEAQAFGARQQQEGVIFHGGSEAGIDLIAFEVSVRGQVDGGFFFARKADATAFDFAFGGEDPVEAVEDAFVGVAVAFETFEDALDDGGFAGAVGAVEEEQAGVSALSNKVAKHPKKGLLDLFLSSNPRGFGCEGAVISDALVKDAKARFFAVGCVDGACTVEAKGVLDVLCGVSAMSCGIFGDFGEVFTKREDATGIFEALLDGSRKREKVKRFHASMLLVRREGKVWCAEKVLGGRRGEA